MAKDTASIAASEVSTLPEYSKEQPTTFLGKPIKYTHDHHTSMMYAEGGGFGDSGAGANLLPPGFTDKSLVRIPIKLKDLNPNPVQEAPKKRGLFRRSSSTDEEFKSVMMSRGDYLKYWAKGEDGNFLPSVQEPPEGRQMWFEKQLEMNEEWKKNDPYIGKSGKSNGRGFPAAALGNAVTALATGLN